MLRVIRHHWLYLLVCALALSLIFWNQRWIFHYQYDREYLRHFFEHSQWSIPESPRTMADAELYQVAGDEIMQTHDLFRVSPETPPLGKILYGFAIHQTGNPYWAVVATFLSTLVVAVWFFWRWWRNWQAVRAAWLMMVTTPLFFTQFQYTNMDLWILFFLLLIALSGEQCTNYPHNTQNEAGL